MSLPSRTTLKRLAADLVSGLALRHDVGLAGGGEERGQHVLVGDDAVERHARLPLRPGQRTKHGTR